MTQEQFLLDTLEYYTEDVNRRCVKGNNGCYYSPVNAKKVGISEGCAIGRHLDSETQLNFDAFITNGGAAIGSILLREIGKNSVPKWMQELGSIYLGEVQMLHDSSDNWTANSISQQGQRSLNYILERFELNKELFTKYLN